MADDEIVADQETGRAGNRAHAVTPMIKQFFALKQKAVDCLLFYRMGDFFELFFDDAVAAAATLNIALTSRGMHDGVPIPMCGVPVHSADAYLARLIRAGHRVAIAEQIESPADAKARGGSKTLVARDIVRFVTAGTLTEETLLDARSENLLVAIAEAGGETGLAAIDISTGRFETASVEPDALAAELARLAPSELIVAEGRERDAPPGAIGWHASAFRSQAGEARLKKLFAVASLDAFGDFNRAELAAAGALVAYLEHAGQGQLPLINPPHRRATGGYLGLDRATRESLEIVRNQSGERAGSLLHDLDRTVTGAGARMLARNLGSPLVGRTAIEARLALVAWFHEQPAVRVSCRVALRRLPDIGRALGRLVAGRGTPRDLGQLRDGLGAAWTLGEQLAASNGLTRPEMLETLLPSLAGHGALIDLLTRALVATPPTDAAQGGLIAEGYDATLDALRETARSGRQAVAALEARYRDQTGVTALKIRHNAVLGYFIEVPARHGDMLMAQHSGFTHRQTMAGAVRFNAPDLHEEAMRIVQAGGHALAAEAAHLEELIAAALGCRDAVVATADALARIDLASALAERAAEDGWTQPTFSDDMSLEIIGGRHPVVETALKSQNAAFVANDCRLAMAGGPDGENNAQRLWLVSGPNMGGKSTFLRQNAIIVLLAQAGSFVPANRARIGIVDRLFSRVGASDNLARGQSTFMVEMIETAAILALAGPRSLVILDEVGRGTSTYDGLALAWAVVEAIHETNRCRCLFATHYHELAMLSESLDALALRHVRAREWRGDLVLLHEIAEGPADRSFGLSVARLAGVPPPVLARAKTVLDRLEQGRVQSGGLAAGLGDLPLFAAALDAAMDRAEAKVDRLRERLAMLDIDALSPRAALNLLYELKRDVDAQ